MSEKISNTQEVTQEVTPEVTPVETATDISPRTDAAPVSFQVSMLPEAELAEVQISTAYGKVIARAMNLMAAVLPTLKSHRKADRMYHDQRVDKLTDLCKTVRDEVISFVNSNIAEEQKKGEITNATGEQQTNQQGATQEAAS